MNNLNYIKK